MILLDATVNGQLAALLLDKRRVQNLTAVLQCNPVV